MVGDICDVHAPKTKTRIETTTIVRAAAGETGGGSFQRPGAREISAAIRANVNVRTRASPDREGERMTTRFARDAEVGASAPPFRAMRRDTTPPCTERSKQMRKLVAQRAIDLRFAVRTQPAIQKHVYGTIFGAACRAAQTARPFDMDLRGEGRSVIATEEIDRDRLQCRIAP